MFFYNIKREREEEEEEEASSVGLGIKDECVSVHEGDVSNRFSQEREL